MNQANFAENPAGQNIRKKKRRKPRRLPPGQRLILYFAFACGLMLTHSLAITADTTSPSAVQTSQALSIFTDTKPVGELKVTTDFNEIEAQLRKEADKPKLHAGIFAYEPATGKYVDVDGHQSIAAASIIKLPVLIALMQEMDKGTLKPSDKVYVTKDLIGGGSGILQWRTPGTQLTLGEATELMIKISDNTATNIVVNALGGMDNVNQRFAKMNLHQTRINNWLPDLGGTNRTSPYELTYLLSRVDQGELISKEGRHWAYQLMEHVKTRSLLPVGLMPGATIAHKTGDIGSMVGDAGIVQAANGKRYIVAIQVERPHNDLRANHLVRHLSRIVYSGFADSVVENISFADIDSQYAAPARAHRSRHLRRSTRHIARHARKGQSNIKYVHYQHTKKAHLKRV
jgi:beta-lactamase class A